MKLTTHHPVSSGAWDNTPLHIHQYGMIINYAEGQHKLLSSLI